MHVIDAQAVWKKCLLFIEDNVNKSTFDTWFKPIKAVGLKDMVLTIQVPSAFYYEFLEEKFLPLLRSALYKEIGKGARLEYSVVVDSSKETPYTVKYGQTNKDATRNPQVSMPLSLKGDRKKGIPNPFVIPGLKKLNINSRLNENYSFENFVEGDCNRLARSAGYAIGKNPGKTAFNPLFLYSRTGLGKTHLSHAIGLEVKKNFPDKTVLYVVAEQFMHQYVEATLNRNAQDFINFYQMIDVLILDDIHFLAGRKKTQDQLFHIFNHLHQFNKQIILTSDKPPVELKGVEERLLSRFKWGLAADLQVPDVETRKAILLSKIKKDGIDLPEKVVDYLASSISTNVRELEGALISIIAQSSLNKKEITLDLAKKMIDKFVISTSREISIDFIQKVVCDYFSIPIDVLNSKTRKREIVQARQLAMFFSKEHTKSSLATIGHYCGKKDHATVLHAVRTVRDLIDTDRQFKQYYKELDKKIRIK